MAGKRDAERELSRRSILRGIGATGVAMAGFTGVAGATAQDDMDSMGVLDLDKVDDDKARAYQEYIDDEAKIEQAFVEHIDSVAQLMESEGVSPPSSLVEADYLNVLPDRIDGKATANIVARFDDEEEIRLHIYPQARRAYAYVGSSTHKRLYDPANGVKPAGCYQTYECKCNCSSGWGRNILNCCTIPGQGTNCDIIDRRCDCPDDKVPC
ncbi:hypothetical protein [Halocatena marina]|uniref:hypothetical protein n=1 Tax=Halocatena marina TaxID=2934937 RepID=UPI00200BD2A2|nr:hypothetical protein [Halocatena marina]